MKRKTGGSVVANERLEALESSIVTKSTIGHLHTFSDIPGLTFALDARSLVGHTHVISDITSLQAALDAKEPTIAAGTAAQYYRGDESWQTLDKTATGLGNVDNTSDANKPVSTATQTALDGKSATGHGHTIANITSLQTTLDGKAALSHSHIIADITGLQDILDELPTLPILISEVTGLQTALDLKAPLISPTFTGTVTLPALQAVNGVTLSVLQGTSNFLRGDGSYAEPAGGPGGSPTWATVEKDLGTVPLMSGSFTITGLSGQTIGKPVIISQAVGPYTSKGTRADEAEMDGIVAKGVITASSAATCYWNSSTFVKGNVKFDYIISA